MCGKSWSKLPNVSTTSTSTRPIHLDRSTRKAARARLPLKAKDSFGARLTPASSFRTGFTRSSTLPCWTPPNHAPAGITMNQITNLEIFSDQFTYSAETGLGIYSGNVRVAGTNLSLTGGQLTIVLPLEERRLQSIILPSRMSPSILEYPGERRPCALRGRFRPGADCGRPRPANRPGARATGKGKRTTS